MAGENRIVAFGSGGSESPANEPQTNDDESRDVLVGEPVADDSEWVESDSGEEFESERSAGLSWLPATLAAITAAAWTGFLLWTRWPAIQQGLTPADWSDLIVQWSVPLLLIGTVWLLVMRHSRREAKRFGDAARILSDESQRLEARLVTVNRELSLAREFIASQSRDLEALGRIAADRLSQNADRLKDLIRDNGEQVETLGAVSENALENMEKLRGQLPVIANSAKDVTNNIGNAGRTAHSQLQEMISGFNRLNEFGRACSQEVINLRERTNETIAEFQKHCDQMERGATTRFARLSEQQAELRTRLETQEVEALAAMRSRTDALGVELQEAKELLETEEKEGLASLRSRLSVLRDEGRAIAHSLRESERQALEDWKSGLEAFEAERSDLFTAIEDAQQRMSETAHAQLGVVAEDAQRIEARMSESSRSFAEELQQLRENAESDNREWIAGLTERFSEFSQDVAGRSRQLAGELDRKYAELQERHQQAMAELAEKCASLDEELSQRASAMRSEIELHHGRLGETHANLLDDLSRQFGELESQANERGRRISEEIERHRSEFTANEEQAISRLSDLLGAMDEQIAERLAAHERQGSAISRQAGEITGELDVYGERLSALAAQGDEARHRISQGLQSITSAVDDAQSLLGSTEKDIAGLTDSSVRLLELIQASASSSQSALPEALSEAERRLSMLEQGIARVRESLEGAGGEGDAIAGRIESSEDALASLRSSAEALNAMLQEHGAEQAETFASLLRSLEDLDGRSEQLAEKARAELSAALDQLAQSAQDALSALGEDSTGKISELAAKLGTESAEAIDRAIHVATAEASGKLEQAAAHASGVGREAALQLRDQLAKVSELVANLEQRVAQARERAEEQVDNDFARRVALITESLNSNSIDIAKALSTDVSDTAWAAYLRGDRGIFTRRAVRLLEAGEAKTIQHIFERDQDFREHVSRYIHDFEAILRQVLSTRDGHALGVTLLSSDMGKLYVALAQGIERLRD